MNRTGLVGVDIYFTISTFSRFVHPWRYEPAGDFVEERSVGEVQTLGPSRDA